MKLFAHSKTSSVQLSRIWNGDIISSHILLGMRLPIHVRLIYVGKEGSGHLHGKQTEWRSQFTVHPNLFAYYSRFVMFFYGLVWRHQMGTFSALLAICAGNPPVPSEIPTQRPVTRSFNVFPDLRLNKWLIKQPRGWWFETPSRPLWRHCNVDNLAVAPVPVKQPRKYGS